jgi:uncharacterized protein YecT (DUF1311 family)
MQLSIHIRVKHFVVNLFALAVATFGNFSFAFDCKKATQADEKIICTSPQAMQLDDEMDQAYSKALANTSEPQRTELKKSQKWWSRYGRDYYCKGDLICLESATLAKTAALDQPATIDRKIQTFSLDFLKAEYGPKLFLAASSRKISFSPDGKWLLLEIANLRSGDADALWLFDVSTGKGKLISSPLPPDPSKYISFQDIMWTADGSLSFVEGVEYWVRNYGTRVERTKINLYATPYQQSRDKLTVYSKPDEFVEPFYLKTEVYGGGHGNTRVWNKGKIVFDLPGSWELEASAIHPQKPIFLVSLPDAEPKYSNGRYFAFDVIAKKILFSLSLPNPRTITAAAISKEGTAAFFEPGWCEAPKADGTVWTWKAKEDRNCRGPKVHVVSINGKNG